MRGWPMGEAMIALMYAHPQVYVDTGIISYAYPRADFHAYLKRMVDAGFANRIMFGSDQMIWPDAIGYAVEGITSAPFLSAGAEARHSSTIMPQRFLRLAKQHQHGPFAEPRSVSVSPAPCMRRSPRRPGRQAAPRGSGVPPGASACAKAGASSISGPARMLAMMRSNGARAAISG